MIIRRTIIAFSLAATIARTFAFAPVFHQLQSPVKVPSLTLQFTASTSSRLYAVGALVKKAKQAELRKYVEDGVEDHVMAKYKEMKAKLDNVTDLKNQTPGPLQTSLTRRKGTITVIAEYKRKNSDRDGGFINEIFIPEIVSATFREFGASGVAVMADERMGGCTYKDLAIFAEEQRRAKNNVPGSVPVINNDLIVDELQIARTAAYGCAACVINLPIVGAEQTETLLKAAKALDLEAIVAVSSKEDAQKAIDVGARILSIIHIEGVDEKVAAIEGLNIPEGQKVCFVANILARNDKQLQEIEEAWAVRDKGFNAVWVGEALFKAGSDNTESPGAIIKSMKSKSSLKFATPKAYTGRGEGAREYLGDILM